MHRGYANVREQVRTCPLALAYLKESSLIEYANSFLTHDTGIEIECYQNNNFIITESKFRKIPDIISVNFDPSEKRFRIPSGIKGLICLYRICQLAKEHLTLNPESGIHYHIDFTKEFELIRQQSDSASIRRTFMCKNNDWLMESIKSWNYTGKFNQSIFSVIKNSSVRFHDGCKTIEYRIGEMSFDYEVLVKRIIHCQNMTKKLSKSLQEIIGTAVEVKQTFPASDIGPRIMGRIRKNGYKRTFCNTLLSIFIPRPA